MPGEDINFVLQQLTDDSFEETSKLQIIRDIKKSLARNFGNVRHESLLSNVGRLLNDHSGLIGNERLLRYGYSLVDYIGRESFLDSKLFEQLESVIKELKNRDEKMVDDLIARTWMRLEQSSIVHPSFAAFLLGSSKAVIERIVLGFFGDSLKMDYYVSLSSDSPDSFQCVTSILNEILIRSEGHEIVLRLISSFIGGVMSICQKKMKNYLGLYAADCCRLVSLLFISPEMYSIDPENTVSRGLVLKLIWGLFLSNRRTALMLLSHYQDWVNPFKQYLDEMMDEDV